MRNLLESSQNVWSDLLERRSPIRLELFPGLMLLHRKRWETDTKLQVTG